MKSINEFETILYNKSPNTRRVYLSRVRKFLKWSKKQGFTPDQLSAIRFIEKFQSSSTKNQTIAAIRLYLRQNGEKIDLLKSVPSVTKSREHLNKSEQKRLLIARQENLSDIRNQLIIRMMLKGGLRISEVLGLKLEDVDINDRSVKIRGDHVKWNKSRITYVDKDTVEILKFYIQVNKNSGPKTKLFNLKPAGFRRAFKRYLRIAGLPETFSPHNLRHTFAINYMQNGGTLDKLKNLMGHTNINTTSIYLNYTNNELKKEYDMVQGK